MRRGNENGRPDASGAPGLNWETTMESRTSAGVGRCTLIMAGAAALAAPPIIRARGEEPVKIGFIDPLTGSLSALAQTEVQGAKYGVETSTRWVAY